MDRHGRRRHDRDRHDLRAAILHDCIHGRGVRGRHAGECAAAAAFRECRDIPRTRARQRHDLLAGTARARRVRECRRSLGRGLVHDAASARNRTRAGIGERRHDHRQSGHSDVRDRQRLAGHARMECASARVGVRASRRQRPGVAGGSRRQGRSRRSATRAAACQLRRPGLARLPLAGLARSPGAGVPVGGHRAAGEPVVTLGR